MYHLKKAISLFFFLVALTACASKSGLNTSTATQTPLPPATPTAAPKTPTTTSQPTATNSPTFTLEAPILIFTPEPVSTDPPGNYILYTNRPNQDLWAVNPEKPTPFLVPSSSNLGVSMSWYSSNKSWIYRENNWLYIIPAEALTANITKVRAIYNYSQFKDGIEPFWFTDDIVMFLDYHGSILSNEPDLYSLNIHTGVATKLLDGNKEGIALVFPDEKKWIKKIWDEGSETYIVDENGNTEKFFDDFDINFPGKFNAPFSSAILRIKRLDKYLFIAKKDGDADYKLWLVSNHEKPSMLFAPGYTSTNEFKVSPDEQYVATMVDDGIDTYRINIFSLDTLQLLYSWTFPFKMTTPTFFWSPDSKKLALDYSTDDMASNNGIQIMDIKTGQRQIILKEGVMLIQGWDSVK